MEYIQGEKFMDLANHIGIFYCHTHDVNAFFENLPTYKNFILISHNSDGCVTNDPKRAEDADSKLMPSNLLLWYGQNINVKNDKIKSIPIGLENNKWLSDKKEKMIAKLKQSKNIRNLVYMNHKVDTNPNERLGLYQLFESKSWVTAEYGKHGYRFDKYIDNVYNHRFVICPEGNGMDTHRIWETLYMGAIPIEKRSINNQFYTDLPICFVNDWKEITQTFLEKEYIKIKTNNWNMEKLDFKYWKNKIYDINYNTIL